MQPESKYPRHALTVQRWRRGLWLHHPGPRFIALVVAAWWLALIAPTFAADEVVGPGLSSHNTLESASNFTNELGSWIWADKTFDGQTCQFWRSFEIPAS